MSADIPSTPPTEVRAGDTIKWRRELGDYPASAGWTLKYTALGSAGVQQVTAAADGDAHAVTVAASASADWAPGMYVLTEYVEKASERYTLATTNLRVLVNLAAATEGVDTRTHARKVLDAIEAWLESKAPVAGSVEIAGRKVSNYPLADLLHLRDVYRAEVRREEAAASGSRIGRLQVRL